MKLRVCFKDHYPCRAETCGEYDVCKVRLAKEKQTNEEWFCGLSTEEKAKWLEEKMTWAAQEQGTFTAKGWETWLKQPHTKGVKKNEVSNMGWQKTILVGRWNNIRTTCDKCHGTGKIEATNEEWFNYLSTKEKAEWGDKVAENCCQICDRENRELCRKNIAIGCKFENAKKWELWLKQPHKEEGQNDKFIRKMEKLRDNVQSASARLYSEKNENTENKYEEALERLGQFEKENRIPLMADEAKVKKIFCPQTNEEWFNGLSTETKARIMHLVYIAGYTDGFNGAETIPLRDIKEWLKQTHIDKE